MKLCITLRSIGIALSTFIIFYIFFTESVSAMGRAGFPDSRTFSLVAIIGTLPWLVSGYIAAALAQKSGILHALTVDMFSSLIIDLDYVVRFPASVENLVRDWCYYLLYGVILCGLGGLASVIKEIVKGQLSRSSSK